MPKKEKSLEEKHRENAIRKNAELLDLYVSKQEVFMDIQAIAMKENITNELTLHLPYVPYEFEDSTIKFMVVGQETNGWSFTLDKIQDDFKKSIESAMQCTEKFQSKPKYNNSPFWSFIYKYIYMAVSIQQLTSSRKKSGVVWSNLNKIAYNDNVDNKEPKSPLPKEIQSQIDTNLNTLLLEEIKIIQPDIIIFLSGLTYDEQILLQLQGAIFKKVKDFKLKELAAIEHNDLPTISMIRTYHPNYILRSGKNNDEFIKRFVAHIEKLETEILVAELKGAECEAAPQLVEALQELGKIVKNL